MADSQVRGDSARVTYIADSIDQACRAHGLAPSRFGRLAVRDPRLVHDLQQGRTLRPATERKIARFIASLGEV